MKLDLVGLGLRMRSSPETQTDRDGEGKEREGGTDREIKKNCPLFKAECKSRCEHRWVS